MAEPSDEELMLALRDGELTEWTLDPAQYGLSGGSPGDLVGGEPADNARTIERLLAGEAPLAARNAVVLNAAAAVYVGRTAGNFGDAVGLATRALESGGAREALARLRAACKL